MFIFRDADKLSGNDAASAWADIWPMIQSHKLKSIDMRAVAGPNVPPGGYLFYWEDLTPHGHVSGHRRPQGQRGLSLRAGW